MKKKILNQEFKEQIIRRIQNLKPDSRPGWGNLNVNEMLFHCRKINKEILRAEQQDKKPTLKQTIMKTVGLRLMKEFPKGVKTGSKYLPATGDDINFIKGQTELIESVNKVADFKGEIYGQHPFFGPLQTREWRRFIWMHLDHHLRQFHV